MTVRFARWTGQPDDAWLAANSTEQARHARRRSLQLYARLVEQGRVASHVAEAPDGAEELQAYLAETFPPPLPEDR